MRWTDLVLLGALAAAGPAFAQGTGVPAAASDWLGGTAPPRPPATGWRPGEPAPFEAQRRRSDPPPGRPATLKPPRELATSAAPPPVGVMRLSDGNPDTKGAIPAEAARLPRDLWGAAPAGDVAQAIAAAQPRLAASRALFQRMLTAQLQPPSGAAAGDEGRLFLARVDRLIAAGRLDDADALLQSAGWSDGPRFARRFDIALLRDTADEVCATMDLRPGLAPDLSARIYCLARTGDWNAAALTLHGARAGGMMPSQTVALLERFLDDGSADLSEPLPDPAQVTPLEFRLFEAIGQPLATADLPLAFAWADLNGNGGWKARLDAAERLARAGAIDPAPLAAAYLDQRPAASGGVWDRAAAFQRIDAALEAGDAAKVSAELPEAAALFLQAGLIVPFARLVGPALSGLTLDSGATETAAHLRLLTGVPGTQPGDVPAHDRPLLALAEGDPGAAVAFPTGSTGAAYAEALAARPLPEAPPEGRGLALLAAMADVEAGLDGDVARAATGLRRMVELGQPADARLAAVELLLTEHMGGPRR
ncbi:MULTISPECIES: hypothetical protein [unclassified Paracoccus (in: a-proteobacteria)]|uniref:hypothetical protein n=1 Tax=unclassified Paracoccus (in: a-proteobacteria) TaxID=2688777 RepID=UPI001603CB0D|nr:MULTISPECIES: hypothetical protein [unclassified Paracoccus (in: a-proteobacteria)]MBB1490882.1 hypothetical protein [Paracoccus sp. MC1854]MBB1497774.1 hypothetical protein [Paracoccus sp. MC1862]QQO45255.1 hypothetical protein JGR78_02405 [Paracoccus sp. MC1862]